MSSIGYQILRPLIVVFYKSLYNSKTIHKERIPKKEGFIFAGTHTSYFDPFIVGSSTRRTIHYLGKKELCDVPVVGAIVRFVGMIPVDRKAISNPKAKEEAVNVLSQDEVICIFPEATINKTDKDIMPFKYGAVSFAKKTGKPIVPFAIIGKSKIFHHHSVKLIVGNPFYVGEDEALKDANTRLENIVIDLIKEGRELCQKKRK